MLPFITPFKGTRLEAHAADVSRAAATSWAFQWLSVLERIWAIFLQVSSRGLVYLSIVNHNPLPACVALIGFATVDGSAYYWHLKKVRFDSWRVLARVHAYLAIMAAVLTGAFLLWSERFTFAAG
jgi:hypothetical protein